MKIMNNDVNQPPNDCLSVNYIMSLDSDSAEVKDLMSAKYFALKFGSCLIFGSCCILYITYFFTLFCSSSALWAKNSYEFFGLKYKKAKGFRPWPEALCRKGIFFIS